MNILLLASIIAVAVKGDAFQIVSMKDWSGEESQRTDVLQNPVSLAIVQHTVTSECLTDEDCLKTLRNVRSYFLRNYDSDMPYSFMIGGNGKVYEGAGWHLVGAHTKYYNNKSIGVAFIGDFREKKPTPQALQAAQDLLTYGVENKYLTEDYKLVGHRQLSNTISPGDSLQNIIEGWPHWSNVQHGNV